MFTISELTSVLQFFEQRRDDDACITGTYRLFETNIRCSASSISGFWIHLQKSHEEVRKKKKISLNLTLLKTNKKILEDNDIKIGEIELSDVDGVLKFNVRVFHRRVSYMPIE